MIELFRSASLCLIAGFLIQFGSVSASTNQVVVDDTAIGATTHYSVTFKVAQAINAAGSQLSFGTNGGADVSAATLASVSGGNNLQLSQFAQTTTNISFSFLAGSSANVGDIVTLNFTGVVNPAAVGLGPDYSIIQIDPFAGPPIPVTTTLPGTVYTGSSQPVVVNPIDDLTGANALNQSDPATEAASDLNQVFDDSDLDPLSFSLDPGTDTSIISVQITVDDRLLVTPIGSGLTTVNVRATASDGSVVDSFDVRVIGDIDDAVMTPDALGVGEMARYVLTFTTPSALSAGQDIRVPTGLGGPDYTNATLDFQPAALTTSLPLPNEQAFRVSIDAGAVPAGTPITITLEKVVNPGNAGVGPVYPISINQISGSILLAEGTAAGNVFEAGDAPFVVNPIANQFLNEIDGPATVVADISTVFDEDDGDPMTYAVLKGNDPLVATAALVNDALIVTPNGPGQTTITVEASDVDGAISDSFFVEVVGIMDDAAFAPISSTTNALTDYTFSFTTSTALGANFLITINNAEADGPDYSQAQLLSVSGGDLIMGLQFAGETGSVIELTGGSAGVGESISFTLGNVRNPSINGTGPDYNSDLVNLFGGVLVESAVVNGTNFEAPVDPVFDDRFEAPPP